MTEFLFCRYVEAESKAVPKEQLKQLFSMNRMPMI